jgi:predicted nucleic acid-binding Zn ribbon protein
MFWKFVPMKKTDKKHILWSHTRANNHCLSCGTDENMGRRKYCSIECRQRLRYNLNMRSGLLKALNTKFATFYFTNSLIFMDVLPYLRPSIFWKGPKAKTPPLPSNLSKSWNRLAWPSH